MLAWFAEVEDLVLARFAEAEDLALEQYIETEDGDIIVKLGKKWCFWDPNRSRLRMASVPVGFAYKHPRSFSRRSIVRGPNIIRGLLTTSSRNGNK